MPGHITLPDYQGFADDPEAAPPATLSPKLLRVEARRTLCHDPYIRDPDIAPIETVVAESDILILATPHREYRSLQIPIGKHVVDIWGYLPPAATGTPE